MTTYAEFLDHKAQIGSMDGFAPHSLPTFLFPFQTKLTEWALRQGRGAILADCGLGKTPMQLAWAEQVARYTSKPVLIATPLAVSVQTEQEAGKFHIEAGVSRDGKLVSNIVITNYERLHYFEPDWFGGMVCDESSILKSFDGTRRAEITAFMRKMKYRLLCTATAAPNDYIELGTSSEALGHLGYMDMLSRFFTNNLRTSHGYYGKWRMDEMHQWRFKGHAEQPFWRWVSSWARAMRKPSDMGFSNDGFQLPPLEVIEHIVTARQPKEGMLFNLPAVGLREEREEAKRTIEERCEKVAGLLSHSDRAVVWCNLNLEGDLLEKVIEGAVQVKGSDSIEAKEESLSAFNKGQIRVLVTKPKIGGWGLNWQHCHEVVFFPSHSYEQYYQAVRRCWRFGQQGPVTVHIVATEGGEGVKKNLARKAAQADRMFENLVAYMNEAQSIKRLESFDKKVEVPSWL